MAYAHDDTRLRGLTPVIPESYARTSEVVQLLWGGARTRDQQIMSTLIEATGDQGERFAARR
jgi:hypothetical protein